MKTHAPPRNVWRQRLKTYYNKIKSLQGDPHHVATGMAIGVLVAVTPTIPFQFFLALLLAFILRVSKPAAAIGVWFCNPVTIPVFYYGSYRFGMWLLGRDAALGSQQPTFQELLQLGLDVTVAMIVAGAILGILPAVIAYIVTFYFFTKLRKRDNPNRMSKQER